MNVPFTVYLLLVVGLPLVFGVTRALRRRKAPRPARPRPPAAARIPVEQILARVACERAAESGLPPRRRRP